MGPITLDKKIMGQMETWGGSYDSLDGCNHNGEADKKDAKITARDVTLNVPSQMDASHAKPASDNPGVDKAFWAKAEPQSDSTGHGRLSRDSKDRM